MCLVQRMFLYRRADEVRSTLGSTARCPCASIPHDQYSSPTLPAWLPLAAVMARAQVHVLVPEMAPAGERRDVPTRRREARVREGLRSAGGRGPGAPQGPRQGAALPSVAARGGFLQQPHLQDQPARGRGRGIAGR